MASVEPVASEPGAVGRRLALIFPGFEPMPVEAHAQRFQRELRKTAKTYGMSLPMESPTLISEHGDVSTAEIAVRAEGDGWATATDVVIYGLGDLNAFYAKSASPVRFGRGAMALVEFIATATFFRYLKHSWRYALFFLYPILLIAGIVCASFAAYALISRVIAPEVAALAGAAVAALLFRFAAAKMHFLLMMDDWAFARDMARERRPELDRRLAAISEDARARIAAAGPAEVVFAAHSFGAITAVSVMASVLEGLRNREIGLLTAGSSLLKVALHPAASRLRTAVQRIIDGETVWLDAQSLTDPMNFYKTNPAGTLGLSGARLPNTARVRFREQLTPASYNAIRRNFFRVHRQFVFGVERRTPYAFHAILCGPEPFADVARRGGLLADWRALRHEAPLRAAE